MKIQISKKQLAIIAGIAIIIALLLGMTFVIAYDLGYPASDSGLPNINGHPAEQIEGLLTAILNALRTKGVYPVDAKTCPAGKFAYKLTLNANNKLTVECTP